jgi:hypothetical protein
MAPIAISNRKPEFVPFSTRPLSIAGQTPRPQQRPVYRPAPYRPPAMLANRELAAAHMGAFNFSELPLSLTLGLVGVSSLILSGILPSPVKQIAMISGLGFLGFGLINMFSASASAATTSGESGAAPFKTAAPDQFGLVTAKIVKPSWNEEVGRGLFSYDYDIEVLWTNNSDKAVSMPYRISVEEKPQGGIGTADFKGVVHTGVVNLGPGQSAQVPLEIDLQHRGIGAADAVGITLKVEKISSANQVFLADSKFFVVY